MGRNFCLSDLILLKTRYHFGKGGYGGVIRTSNGHILVGLSRSVDYNDANGAKVFAMLMGRRELYKMEANNAIVKGDIFSAVQWGYGKSRYPWRLANSVEEVHHISAQLNCCFHHILREANYIANHLAREGASSLLFLFVIWDFFLL